MNSGALESIHLARDRRECAPLPMDPLATSCDAIALVFELACDRQGSGRYARRLKFPGET